MLTIDLSDFKAFARDLDLLQKRSIPFAVRDTLNAVAFEGRKFWLTKLDKEFVLRSTWTARSVRVVKATGSHAAGMQSVLGTVAPYMLTQEQGGTVTSKGKHGAPVPTTSAAGQAMKARPRTKLVQRKNWLSAIQLRGKVSGIRQRKNAVAIAVAAKTNGVAFLNLGRRKGLFRIARTGKGSMRVRMLWDMSKRSHAIPRSRTLEPSAQLAAARIPYLGRKAIEQQLRFAITGSQLKRR